MDVNKLFNQLIYKSDLYLSAKLIYKIRRTDVPAIQEILDSGLKIQTDIYVCLVALAVVNYSIIKMILGYDE